MRASLHSLALLALVASSAAAAFTPAPVADPALRALRAELGATRLIGANTVDGLWSGGAGARYGISRLLEPTGAGDGLLFAESLAHSTEALVVQGDRAISGWRDPLTDVWLAGDWRLTRAGDGSLNWQLKQSTLVLTQDLAGAGKGQPAPLFGAAGKAGFAAGIAQSHRDAVTAFRQAAATPDKLPWGKDPRASRAREVALLRLDAARVARAALFRAAPAAPGVVDTALVEETPAIREISDSVARGLAALPTEVRLSLRIVSAVPVKDRVLAIVQSTLQPATLYVVHLQGSGDDVRLANVESIDLTKAE